MSRIGKLPIEIPDAVKLTVKGQCVSASGPKGNLTFELPATITLTLKDGKALLEKNSDESQSKALHGLSRALVANMVRGVHQGFLKKLEIHGVGFKAGVQDGVINLNLGYSHQIRYQVPAQIKVTVDENTKITIEGPDKQMVGKVASELRSFYPPEPYKGKGVRYVGEHIIRKEGKTVQ